MAAIPGMAAAIPGTAAASQVTVAAIPGTAAASQVTVEAMGGGRSSYRRNGTTSRSPSWWVSGEERWGRSGLTSFPDHAAPGRAYFILL